MTLIGHTSLEKAAWCFDEEYKVLVAQLTTLKEVTNLNTFINTKKTFCAMQVAGLIIPRHTLIGGILWVFVVNRYMTRIAELIENTCNHKTYH